MGNEIYDVQELIKAICSSDRSFKTVLMLLSSLEISDDGFFRSFSFCFEIGVESEKDFGEDNTIDGCIGLRSLRLWQILSLAKGGDCGSVLG